MHWRIFLRTYVAHSALVYNTKSCSEIEGINIKDYSVLGVRCIGKRECHIWYWKLYAGWKNADSDKYHISSLCRLGWLGQMQQVTQETWSSSWWGRTCSFTSLPTPPGLTMERLWSALTKFCRGSILLGQYFLISSLPGYHIYLRFASLLHQTNLIVTNNLNQMVM